MECSGRNVEPDIKENKVGAVKSLSPVYWYLEVEMAVEGGSAHLSAGLVQVLVLAAVDTMFGEAAKSLPVDVLRYEPKESVAVVRVAAVAYSRVRAALTVCGQARVCGEERAVEYRVRGASPCLLALAAPHRSIT